MIANQRKIYFEYFEQYFAIKKAKVIELCKVAIEGKPYELSHYGKVLDRAPVDRKLLYCPLNMNKDHWIDLLIELSKEQL